MIAFAWLGATVALFAYPLTRRWVEGATDWYVLGGIVPWSDAREYYSDALRILDGHRMSTTFPGRPLYAGALASLLTIVGLNLRAALAAQTAVVAASCFVFAWQVHRTHGPVAGGSVLFLLAVYASSYTGATMTETLGLSLGALGWGLLWWGARRPMAPAPVLGTFLVALALNARAGAFLVLPALIVWGVRRAGAMQFGAWAAAAVLAAFAVNALLYRAIGPAGVVPFANFGFVLYGVVTGGDWTTIYSEHPELRTLAAGEAGQRALSLALGIARERPDVIVRGALRAWSHFLLPRSHDSLFTFPVATALLQAFTVAGVASCLPLWSRGPRLAVGGLLLWSMVGVAASVPFAPPGDAGGMRAYAATLPITAAVASVGASWVVRTLRRRLPTQAESDASGVPRSIWFATLLGGALVAATVVLPVRGNWYQARPVTAAHAICPEGQRLLSVRLTEGSFFKLLADGAARNGVVGVRVTEFRRGLHPNWRGVYPAESVMLSSLSAGTIIVATTDVVTGESLLLVGSDVLRSSRTVTTLCAEKVPGLASWESPAYRVS